MVNSFVPVFDSGVEIEPASLSGFTNGEGPADGWVEVKVAGGAEVIRSMYEAFERVI